MVQVPKKKNKDYTPALRLKVSCESRLGKMQEVVCDIEPLSIL